MLKKNIKCLQRWEKKETLKQFYFGAIDLFRLDLN